MPKNVKNQADKQEFAALLKRLNQPDEWHRPACYWFWQHIPNREEIVTKLAELKAGGFGSFQIAARLSLPIEDYLSDAWLQACRLTADLAREQGLMMGIYDDYNWQSGHAGGRVAALNPELKERHLFWSHIDLGRYFEEHKEDDPRLWTKGQKAKNVIELKISDIHSGDADCLFDVGKNWIYEGGKPVWDKWELICVYHVGADGKTVSNLITLCEHYPQLFAAEVTDSSLSFQLHPVVLKKMQLPGHLVLFASARCKTSRMVNYLLPETAEAFIKTTYEPYAKALGAHLGTTVRYAFFDQPHSCFYQWEGNDSNVRSSLMYSQEFLEKLGMGRNVQDLNKVDPQTLQAKIAERLIALIGDFVTDSKALRAQVFEIYSELAFKNYFTPLRNWCHQHKLLFTGHEVLGHVHSWNFADTVITEDNRCNFGMDYFGLGRLRDITAVDAKNSVSQISAKVGDSISRVNGRSGCILEQYYGREEPGSHFGAGYWELSARELYIQVMRHHILGMQQFLMHAFYLDDGTFDNDEVFVNPRLDFGPGINYVPWYIPFFAEICRQSGIVSEFNDSAFTMFYDFAIVYPRRNFYVSGMAREYGQYCADLCRYLSTHGYDYLIIDEDNLCDYSVIDRYQKARSTAAGRNKSAVKSKRGRLPEDTVPKLRLDQKDHKLQIGTACCSALLLPCIHTISSTVTMANLTDLQRCGARIFITGDLPSITTMGSVDQALLDQTRNALDLPDFKEYIFTRIEPDCGELNTMFASKFEEKIAAIKQDKGVYLEYSPRRDPVWMRTGMADGRFYVTIFNESEHELNCTLCTLLRCKVHKLNFAGSCVQTVGEHGPLSFTELPGFSTRIPLTLKPFETACLVLSELETVLVDRQVLDKGWTLQTEGMQEPINIAVDRGLEQQDFETFKGCAVYRLDLKATIAKEHPNLFPALLKGLRDKSLTADKFITELWLPECNDAVELYINGRKAGQSMGGSCSIELELNADDPLWLCEIKVYTTAGNYYYQNSRWRTGCATKIGLTQPPQLKITSRDEDLIKEKLKF